MLLIVVFCCWNWDLGTTKLRKCHFWCLYRAPVKTEFYFNSHRLVFNRSNVHNLRITSSTTRSNDFINRAFMPGILFNKILFIMRILIRIWTSRLLSNNNIIIPESRFLSFRSILLWTESHSFLVWPVTKNVCVIVILYLCSSEAVHLPV